jgi:hypothetical protein
MNDPRLSPSQRLIRPLSDGAQGLKVGEMNAIDLPAVVSMARLPQTYVKAKTALAACDRMDECKDWADKAEAMASYARQSGDTELRKMADRIQARAIDRCGQLIKQIPAEPGKRTDKGEPQLPWQPRLSDRDVARIAACMSRHQAKTAVAVNNVPRARFEREVESEKPPSVKKLAAMGRKAREAPKPEARPATVEEKAAATKLRKAVSAFTDAVDDIKIDAALNGGDADEGSQLIEDVRKIEAWLSILAMRLKSRRATVERRGGLSLGRIFRRSLSSGTESSTARDPSAPAQFDPP